MQVKNNSNIRLHKMAEIKSVSQDEHKPNILYIEGYASFYQNQLGIKEVDRDQEIVNIDGLDITAYQKNPVLLWGHNWNSPCGKVLSMNKDGNGLFVRCEMQRLTGKEADFENVLYGNVKSFSIGFIPLEYQYLDNAVEITQSEMIELSIAPVQSNRSALFQVVGTKSLDIDKAGLIQLLEPNKKDTDMKINNKDAANPAEPTVAPTQDPATPAVEPTPTTAATQEPVTPPEVKVEVKNELDVSELAKQLVAAEAEAKRIADEAKAEKEAKEAEAQKLAKEAEAQKLTDALAYISSVKDTVLAISSFDELNEKADEINKAIEPITAASEAIIAKVIELSKEAAGIPATTEE